MAATYSISQRVPFGVGDPLPLEGFPEGRAKIKIRNDDFTKVYIKTKTGIHEFYPTEKNGKWIPLWEVGRNERT